MRVSIQRVLAAAFFGCFASIGVAQTTSTISDIPSNKQNYPWRISDDSAVSPQAPTTNAAPVAPVINASGVTFKRLGTQDKPTQEPDLSKYNADVPQAPANAAPGSTETQPGLSVASNATNEGYGFQNNQCDWCQIGEVKRIFGGLPGRTAIGGFAQTGYHDRNNLGFNNRQDQFNAHQIWLFADRSAQQGAGWSMGYRIDAVYGIDGQDIQSTGNSPTGAPTGWDNSWDFGSYGWALPQAYVNFANCDWNVRVGRFLSPFGYEAVPSIENFFYSRTYVRQFTQPFGHTGIIGERQVTSQLSTITGATLGWDSGFDQTDNGFNFIGGVRYRPGQYVNVGVTSSVGDTGVRGSGVAQSLVLQMQLTDNVQYVFTGDYVNLQANIDYGMTNSLFYCVNPCLALGTRLEWWKTDQLFPNMSSTYDWTVGLNYRPHANIVIRPEARYDWGAAAVNPDDVTLGIDAIIAF